MTIRNSIFDVMDDENEKPSLKERGQNLIRKLSLNLWIWREIKTTVEIPEFVFYWISSVLYLIKKPPDNLWWTNLYLFQSQIKTESKSEIITDLEISGSVIDKRSNQPIYDEIILIPWLCLMIKVKRYSISEIATKIETRTEPKNSQYELLWRSQRARVEKTIGLPRLGFRSWFSSLYSLQLCTNAGKR